MKFLPYFRPTAVVMLAVTLGACSTPANRRELYNVSEGNSGPWHDYTRRRQAEAQTGINSGVAPTVLPGQPRSTVPTAPTGAPGPLPPGASEPAMQSPLTPATPPPAPVAPPPSADPTAAVPIDAGGATAPVTTPPADSTTPARSAVNAAGTLI